MHMILKRLRWIPLIAVVLGLVLIATPLAPSAGALAPHVADSVSDACAGIGVTGANCGGGGGGTKVGDVVKTLVNILTAIVGVAAVIMIIIAGFKYITSGGDTNSVANAKNTLIYVIVGLVVAAMAQFIVHYVVLRASP